MVLESPAAVMEFLLERYRNSMKSHGDVLKNPKDYYDMAFPEFVDESAGRIYELAKKLRKKYSWISDEDHVLMAYLLHVIDTGKPHNAAPHNRIIQSPARFFYDYLSKAGFDLNKLLSSGDYKYKGVPVRRVLDGVSDHGLGEHVLDKRFTPPRR